MLKTGRGPTVYIYKPNTDVSWRAIDIYIYGLPGEM